MTFGKPPRRGNGRLVSKLGHPRVALRTQKNHKMVSREEYILRALQTAFPTAQLVDASGLEQIVGCGTETSINGDVGPAEGGSGQSGPGRSAEGVIPSPPSSNSLTLIGGAKYDEDLLANYLLHSNSIRLITGVGRGAESEAMPYWVQELRGDAEVIEADPDLFGKAARKVNVEQVLCADPNSPLLLVGDGERVKSARAWLRRTGSKREVIELP